jgi:2-keto-3-deoxy-L-fuconate dehydrogenase
MGKRLKAKTALITGAGRGIGRCIAETFAMEGCRVWATSKSMEPLRGLKAIDGIQIHQLDVTDAGSVAQASEKIDGIDVLVNNAGHVATGTVLDCTDADLRQSLDVNLYGAYHMIRAFLPGMLAQGTGIIINIASVLSSISSAAERFAYGVSKGAAERDREMVTIARELAASGKLCGSGGAVIGQLRDPSDLGRLSDRIRMPSAAAS